jgi:hypothetical protein
MAKKKKPVKKPTKKPAAKKPARKPAPRKPAPQKKKSGSKSKLAPQHAAHSKMGHAGSSIAMMTGICTINQPDGTAPVPVGPISVTVTVTHDTDQVCGVRAGIVTSLPGGDPLDPIPTAIHLVRDPMDPTKWTGTVSAMATGAHTILAWPCIITDRCTRGITVTGMSPPPPPPPPPPLPPPSPPP